MRPIWKAAVASAVMSAVSSLVTSEAGDALPHEQGEAGLVVDAKHTPSSVAVVEDALVGTRDGTDAGWKALCRPGYLLDFAECIEVPAHAGFGPRGVDEDAGLMLP